MDKVHMVIVTGLSGSGKSTAIKALEDTGFFCVDNLPVVILDKFLLLCQQHEQISRVALGIDAREKAFLDSFAEVIDRVQGGGHRVDVVFVDASDDVIIRRFSETRRRHPLEGDAGSLAGAIALERQVLAKMRERARWVIDTSRTNIHELKARVQEVFDPA